MNIMKLFTRKNIIGALEIVAPIASLIFDFVSDWASAQSTEDLIREEVTRQLAERRSR